MSAHLDSVFGKQYDGVNRPLTQECVWLEGSFSVDFNSNINTQTEHTRVFLYFR